LVAELARVQQKRLNSGEFSYQTGRAVMGSGRFHRILSRGYSDCTEQDPRDIDVIDLTIVEQILFAALEKRGPERAAYLDKACGQDVELRQQVERLLAAHPRAAGFMEAPAPGLGATVDDPPLGERPGTVIGPYKLLEQIGAGGMGLVFVAEQQQPVRRRVALKIIKPGMDSQQVIARFEAERQALALMDHQNIAKVLDAGTTPTGRPYFVMELVHGIPITTYCDANQLTPRQRLELFIPVCLAIQHAHQKGIIHRDIKPTNVLVTMYDDKPVPKVIDFGVAKAIEQRLTEKTVYTQFGTLVGTFEYMSPEQAEMNALGVDTRSDIYSLGVLLYELLTGTTPLEQARLKEAAYGEIVRLIKEEEPPRPSVRLSTSGALVKVAAARKTDPAKLSRLVRGELDWVVMKCLEKQRTRRYDSAGGLARDVERYLKDEPIEARPPSARYRFEKFARRNKVVLVTAALVAVALVLGTVVSAWQAIRATAAEWQARRNEEEAQDQKREADQAKEEAVNQRDELQALNATLRRARYIADMNLAHHAWAENNLIRTRQLLELHRPRPGEADPRGFEWHYLRRLFNRELQVMQASIGMVTAIAFTSDGKQLVSCGMNPSRRVMVLETVPRVMKLWDVATGRQLPLNLDGPTDQAESLAISPDGTRLVAACGYQGIRLWDLASGRQSTLQRHGNEREMYAGFSPDGKRLVTISLDEETSELNCAVMRLWDLAGSRVLTTIDKLPPISVLRAEFSSDGKLLAIADRWHSSVRVFDATTGRAAFSCSYRDGKARYAVFSPDGKRLAACGERGIQIWDVSTHEMAATWQIASNVGEYLAYSPDGKLLAVGSREGPVELWETGTGQKIHTFNGHAGITRMIAFSPDGTRMASAGSDGTVRVWDPNGRRETIRLSGVTSNLASVRLGPDAKAVLAVAPGGVRLGDAATGEPRGGAIPVEPGTKGHDWTADGRRLLLFDSEKSVKLCDVTSGKVVGGLPIDAERSGPLAVSPDGKWYAHAAAGGVIKVRDLATGAESRTIHGLEDRLHFLVFSPDGARLLAVDNTGAMKIWDSATGRQTAAARLTNVYWVTSIRFSSDGKRVAIVGGQAQSLGAVRVLDAQSGRQLLALEGHADIVMDADFSPDGQRLATCGMDRTIRLWDLTAGQEILILRGHTLSVSSVRFVADGRRLISASADGTVRTWDATPLPD
jgi:WD40 repeat protein/serine/threonine protein kinase